MDGARGKSDLKATPRSSQHTKMVVRYQRSHYMPPVAQDKHDELCNDESGKGGGEGG